MDLSKSLIENSVGGCSSGFVSIFVLNLVVLCSYKIFGVCEDFLFVLSCRQIDIPCRNVDILK